MENEIERFEILTFTQVGPPPPLPQMDQVVTDLVLSSSQGPSSSASRL
jgi:hypothetical protein